VSNAPTWESSDTRFSLAHAYTKGQSININNKQKKLTFNANHQEFETQNSGKWSDEYLTQKQKQKFAKDKNKNQVK